MRIANHAAFMLFIAFSVSLIIGTASFSGAGPIFVPIPDTTVCEGDELIMMIYADVETPGDALEFEIENTPQGAEFVAIPPG